MEYDSLQKATSKNPGLQKSLLLAAVLEFYTVQPTANAQLKNQSTANEQKTIKEFSALTEAQ